MLPFDIYIYKLYVLDGTMFLVLSSCFERLFIYRSGLRTAAQILNFEMSGPQMAVPFEVYRHVLIRRGPQQLPQRHLLRQEALKLVRCALCRLTLLNQLWEAAEVPPVLA